MRVLDLFSAAAGGWSLGLHRAGFETVAACEWIDWRRTLYAENNPGVLIYDDVRTLTGERLLTDLGTLPDIVVGSPPCQDISSANTKGKGVDGERSGLFFEAVRIIGEVRPRWFALENSANLRTRGADRVLGELEGLDYACWAVVVGGDNIGANHERKRSWVIGCDIGQLADADQAGQADGSLVASLRQAEIAHDGRGSGRGNDRSLTGQVGLRPSDRGAALQHRADWSLDDLARHIRMDDGLPAWLAQQRIAVGGPRGTSAASLIVEAFGDAVLPQIPEAIGRAILRTEAALSAVYHQKAAA